MNAEDVIELYDLLSKNEIVVWLDGGWGVDALLGKQTRQHKDLDIEIQKKDVKQLRDILENKGYREIKLEIARPHNFVLGDKKGHEVDVHVIILDEKGNGIYGPVENGDMFSKTSLAANGKINNREVKCLSPDFQVKSHSGYKLKEKDNHDIIALCKRFNIPYPEEYKK